MTATMISRMTNTARIIIMTISTTRKLPSGLELYPANDPGLEVDGNVHIEHLLPSSHLATMSMSPPISL